MSEQNRKYYSRGNEILKDEIFFKISNNSDHENKFLVEKIETKNKKKFIKQYKLTKAEIDFLAVSLKKKNIKILSSSSNNSYQINKEIINNRHPEYINGNVLHLDSYRKTITAKFDEMPFENQTSMARFDSYNQNSNYAEIN